MFVILFSGEFLSLTFEIKVWINARIECNYFYIIARPDLILNMQSYEKQNNSTLFSFVPYLLQNVLSLQHSSKPKYLLFVEEVTIENAPTAAFRPRLACHSCLLRPCCTTTKPGAHSVLYYL